MKPMADTLELFLITGFLGSGKTTLLRQALAGQDGAHPRTAILVNEFGAIGIDGDLLADLPVPVTELTSGCICCSMRYGLVKAMKTIIEQYRPERFIIEASGIADPNDILKTIAEAELLNGFRFCKVVTVLSVDLWEDREMFGPLFFNQIEAADLLLLNKIDLRPDKATHDYLAEIRQVNSHCAIHVTSRCQISTAMLWSPPTTPDCREIFLPNPGSEQEKNATTAGYGTFSFINDIPFNNDCFRHFIDRLPGMLHRVKGFARLGDRRFILQYSNGQSEWTPTSEPGPTKLTFIGKNLNETHLVAELHQCLQPSLHAAQSSRLAL